jgi:transcriptional regulator with XRE-family HTH domain
MTRPSFALALSSQQAGLQWYGEDRRVPGLRREEVALLAGVSVDYYIRLERGKAPPTDGGLPTRS